LEIDKVKFLRRMDALSDTLRNIWRQIINH